MLSKRFQFERADIFMEHNIIKNDNTTLEPPVIDFYFVHPEKQYWLDLPACQNG